MNSCLDLNFHRQGECLCKLHITNSNTNICVYITVSIFNLLLNRCLVSSYDGKFGSVQYYVKAVIEKSGQTYAECKRYFEVEESIDVNTHELMVSKCGDAKMM